LSGLAFDEIALEPVLELDLEPVLELVVGEVPLDELAFDELILDERTFEELVLLGELVLASVLASGLATRARCPVLRFRTRFIMAPLT
jgi:hypothetical protein